jgi:2,4-dichlorophenol 6-monooxygenase
MTATVTTDVLVVGTVPAGASAALMLATYGIDVTVINKFGWTCRTPRAHITNQRTMEVLRDLGVEDEAMQFATHQELMGNNVFCESLAGEELGRLLTWGNHPRRKADYTLASPSMIVDIPQNLMEPVLVSNAARRGAKVRFHTEYVSLTQDEGGVTATVRDLVRGDTYDVRAKYLIGADGGNSKVAADIGLPMEGRMGVAGSMNIVFEADLSRYVAHRPSVLYWVLQPGANVGGIGMGLVRMVRPWHEWLIVWGYDINEGAPEVDDDFAIGVVHSLVGDDTIPVKIKSTSVWTVNDLYARENTRGRVFCMGDAVHRHPPSNGLGSNTSIQDAYNLAWKLAMVLKGQAEPSLLDTYNLERSPVAKQIVTRANQSIREFGPIFEALGLLETKDPALMRSNMQRRKLPGAEGEDVRRKLREAIAFKSYEFNAHGVEMNQRYQGQAVVPDGSPEPAFERDRELYYAPTTWPGARLPHVWLVKEGEDTLVSTLDLVGKGRFTVLTGINGRPWAEAAARVGAALGIEVAAHVIGPGETYFDTFGEWAEIREVEEDGVILVRPDAHVGWRAMRLADDCDGALTGALASILGRRAALAMAAE